MWDLKSELNTLQPSRIGLMGGTFDPIHTGHLIMAQDALERLNLDEVCFIPAATPPHKRGDEITQGRHRVAMIEAAIQDDPRMSRSLIELDRGGTSYTIDTVRELVENYSETDFFFIIGGDTLFELYTWKETYKLIETCSFIVVARPGFEFGRLTPKRTGLDTRQLEKLKEGLVVGHRIEISSTDIRARIAEGLSIRYLVPGEVERYIAEHNLYR